MKILFLAPMPVYQDRGSPIAVKMVLEVMSERGDQVDLVTYHEGTDLDLPHVTFHRIANIPVRGVRPGFSLKKLVCDFFMLFVIIRLLLRGRYDLVFAVEESVFFALIIRLLTGTPYVYDMDSSLAQQMVEKLPALNFLTPALNFFERLAVRHALAVVPVCDALGDIARQHDPRQHIVLLYDVPLLSEVEMSKPEDLRAALGIDGQMLLYVGNLEAYQGIDLLLDSFARAADQAPALHLVVIGGKDEHIDHYRRRGAELKLAERVHFVGPRPLDALSHYLAQADILASPRTKGNNTPMKIYSYLDSGKPILATDLYTHTQVLTPEAALLAPPQPEAFASALVQLAGDRALQRQLGDAGRDLIAEKYNYAVYHRTLTGLLDWLKQRVTPASTVSSAR